MNDNKELNDNLQRLFSTIKDAYGIASMIKDIKEKKVADKPKDYALVTSWHDGTVIIKQATRLSDNEIFKIKDLTDEGTIKDFYEMDNFLWVRFEEKGGVVSINDIQKVKERKVLFYTEDNVPIFEGDEYWYVYEDFKIKRIDKADNSIKGGKLDRFFSTEDKAKEFKLMNKPCLSINDVVSVDHAGNGKVAAIVLVKLIELVNKKINNQ